MPEDRKNRPMARISRADYDRICQTAYENMLRKGHNVDDQDGWAAVEDEAYRLLIDTLDRKGVDVRRRFVYWRGVEAEADWFQNVD